ncbi:hypothetical protein WJX72_000563 [[Myrmecia] bisecta]|uniref:SET domain-containing protein n=1 Tax=[Myrmecia] bisecta TaxID=41462 RepID=A0AAW1P580_9CHLO
MKVTHTLNLKGLTRPLRGHHKAPDRPGERTGHGKRVLGEQWRGRSSWPARAAAASEGTATAADAEQASPLQAFLAWLVANGVQGIGSEGTPIGIWQGEDEQRGILCVSDIPKGQVIMRVPLRLALVDHEDDLEAKAALYAEAPWSVRLAAKLLRELAKGHESPWAAYLQVLPAVVDGPLTTFAWGDFKEIQYDPMMEQVHAGSWLLSDAYPRLEGEAIGGATREQFEWAMSVVHSRTFGSAAEEGGVGVRMLLPLVDMLNHGGDETAFLLQDPSRPADNVEWELVSPQKSPSEEWEMVVSAKRDIQEGEEVLLSYGERSNDDFFLHYGFVPARNAHDDVILFASLEEALDWHTEVFPHEGSGQGEYEAALQAGRAAAPEVDGAAAKLPSSQAKQVQAVKLVAGNRLDVRLMAAYNHLAEAEGPTRK